MQSRKITDSEAPQFDKLEKNRNNLFNICKFQYNLFKYRQEAGSNICFLPKYVSSIALVFFL